MNFLQLAQKLRQECGVAGLGPVSTNGQVNEAKRLVDYIKDAWLEIQGKHENWMFMRSSFSAVVTAGQGERTPVQLGITNFRRWDTETLRCYRTADGIVDEQFLIEWDYKVFRDTYRFGQQAPGRPVVFAIRPENKAIMLGSVPETSYTLTGDYITGPVTLNGDADTPAIPEGLHMVIVYKAMEYYGLFESAPEVLERARRGLGVYMPMLERDQLPDIGIGGGMA